MEQQRERKRSRVFGSGTHSRVYGKRGHLATNAARFARSELDASGACILPLQQEPRWLMGRLRIR